MKLHPNCQLINLDQQLFNQDQKPFSNFSYVPPIIMKIFLNPNLTSKALKKHNGISCMIVYLLKTNNVRTVANYFP